LRAALHKPFKSISHDLPRWITTTASPPSSFEITPSTFCGVLLVFQMSRPSQKPTLQPTVGKPDSQFS
jgi:hypothetical protein